MGHAGKDLGQAARSIRRGGAARLQTGSPLCLNAVHLTLDSAQPLPAHSLIRLMAFAKAAACA
jgi:hypothetical protein